jgi:thiamine biosynthesis lipoprotein
MGMHVTVEIVAPEAAAAKEIESAFDYFAGVDQKFSTYKTTSEISAINRGGLAESDWSAEMQLIFALAEKTKRQTNGYFDIRTPEGGYDPSGIVKGWAIHEVANRLRARGFEHFYVDAGGDIEAEGLSETGEPWRVGIRNPFNTQEIVKVVAISAGGIATSGTYERGQHIYDPHRAGRAPLADILSLTVIGPDILEADRFATAAFAMGADGINFIESRPGLEGYAISREGRATMTSGFAAYSK